MAIPTSPLALSIAHLCELEVAPAPLIEMCAVAGFASVGLRTAPAAPGGIDYPLATAREQAEIRRLTAATGVTILAVELISIDETTRPADHRAMIEIGAEIGASRVVVAGNSANHAVVAAAMAEICDIARPLGLAVDLEFMPFRGIGSFSDAAAVIRMVGRTNAHILVDALHVVRSGSSLSEIAEADRALLGTFQLCDAPTVAPARDQLVVEARTNRLAAGTGGLPLDGLLDILPADLPVAIEVPMAALRPDLPPAERLTLLAAMSRRYLEGRRAAHR